MRRICARSRSPIGARKCGGERHSPDVIAILRIVEMLSRITCVEKEVEKEAEKEAEKEGEGVEKAKGDEGEGEGPATKKQRGNDDDASGAST